MRYLQQLGCRLTVAGNEWQRAYIEATFPGIHTIHLDGYNVHYSKTGIGFLPALSTQLPRLMQTISEERRWLKKVTDTFGFHGIITDNRYGLYHDTIPSVIITHQVVPQTGWGWLADKTLQLLHDERLNRFDECWIVDVKGTPNLAGSLSHSEIEPVNARYIGLLSQIENIPAREEHLLVVLSGPEPQRTMLSDMLWEQLQHYKDKIVFVEGSDEVQQRDVPQHIEYHKRLTADKLAPLLASANVVICRSGYSTLMDLIALKKKAIIIPTPGQAEQEYLAKYLHSEEVFYHAQQKHLDILASLNNVQHFPFRPLAMHDAFEQYKPAVDDWLQRL